MDANSWDINRFKAKVNKFSGIISRDLKKPEKKFIRRIITRLKLNRRVIFNKRKGEQMQTQTIRQLY